MVSQSYEWYLYGYCWKLAICRMALNKYKEWKQISSSLSLLMTNTRDLKGERGWGREGDKYTGINQNTNEC